MDENAVQTQERPASPKKREWTILSEAEQIAQVAKMLGGRLWDSINCGPPGGMGIDLNNPDDDGSFREEFDVLLCALIGLLGEVSDSIRLLNDRREEVFEYAETGKVAR